MHDPVEGYVDGQPVHRSEITVRFWKAQLGMIEWARKWADYVEELEKNSPPPGMGWRTRGRPVPDLRDYAPPPAPLEVFWLVPDLRHWLEAAELAYREQKDAPPSEADLTPFYEALGRFMAAIADARPHWPELDASLP